MLPIIFPNVIDDGDTEESLCQSQVFSRTSAAIEFEGIEYTKHKFCLGVQWHPEYHVTEYDQKIFEAFVAVCV
ncbi:MAG: hypothetical protein WCJ33_03255 [Pseudomonadota bacterium]